MRIVGRRSEQDELRRWCDSGKPEFIVVYGRRRVGKTFLVREYFGGEFAFYATGIAGGPTRVQLRAFNESLSQHGAFGRSRGGTTDAPRDWFEAFACLRELLERDDIRRDAASGRRVVFIDEMPWLDTPRSDFRAALEFFWNGWASAQPDVMLVVCGSATSWVVKNLLKERGGLHNRVTGRLRLEPFTLGECEQYFADNDIVMSRHQQVESYMVFGGVPFYLDLMDRRLSLAQNIDRLCFSKAAPLGDELSELYRSLFRNPERHLKVIQALSKRLSGMTRSQIGAQTGIAGGGTLTSTLDELEQCGFVRRYRTFTKRTRDAVYQLVDPFTLFALRFMRGEHDEHFWTNRLQGPSYRAWSGNAFEAVCVAHVDQMKAALGIAGVETDACGWRSSGVDPGAQIDLLLDRSDGVVNVCEMKFTQAEFVIDKDYERSLRNKLFALAAETGTRKAIHLTMVTMFGVAHNEHAGIVQSQIIADDLFA